MDNGLDNGPTRWVTGGTDGRVKYWQLIPAHGKVGKRSPTGDIPASITCSFTSGLIDETLPNRGDYVKRRQSGKPDDIALVRCDTAHNVVGGVTEDGDLRVWFSVGCGDEREVRVDVGSAEDKGGVKRLELDVQSNDSASILVWHHRSATFARYDIEAPFEGDTVIDCHTFNSPVSGAFSAIHACLRPTPAISTRPVLPPILSTSTPPTVDDIPSTSEQLPIPTPAGSPQLPEVTNYGRFVVTGDEHGVACIWEWDSDTDESRGKTPLRIWPAMNGRITCIDASCGLIALGR